MKLIASFAIVIIACSSSVAQGLTKAYDESCQCTVVENHYSDGTVSSHHEENSKGHKHGTEAVYFPDGRKQYERHWKNNRLDGAGVHYHASGAIYLKDFHENGVKSGTWSFYDPDGDLTQEIIYSGGGNDGTYKFYHAGINYLTQTVVHGALDNEVVHNEEIYEQLKLEAEDAKNAKKQID